MHSEIRNFFLSRTVKAKRWHKKWSIAHFKIRFGLCDVTQKRRDKYSEYDLNASDERERAANTLGVTHKKRQS